MWDALLSFFVPGVVTQPPTGRASAPGTAPKVTQNVGFLGGLGLALGQMVGWILLGLIGWLVVQRVFKL